MYPEHFWPSLFQMHIDSSPNLSHQDPWVLFCTFSSADWTLPHTGAWSGSSPGSLNFWRFPSDNSAVNVPLDISTTLFGLSVPPASLVRLHLCGTPRSVAKVLNRIVPDTEPSVHCQWLATSFWATCDVVPLMPTLWAHQITVSSCFHCSPTWHELYWFV